MSINPTKVSVTIVPTDGTNALPVLVNGEPEKVDEVRAKEIMVQDEFEIVVDLEMGDAEAKYWTCDFSYVSGWFCFIVGVWDGRLPEGLCFHFLSSLVSLDLFLSNG